MRRAFTLIELLCTIAIIALLAALLLPVISRACGQVRRAGCANNLKNIGVAFHAWAHDHNDLFPMQVSTNVGGTREFADATILNPDVSLTFRHFQALSNELVVAKLLRCPADPFRAPADDFSSLRGSNVSYWINVNARFGDTESPIAGDRNVRTSGRMAWTFVQFSADDALEFSAELHGARGKRPLRRWTCESARRNDVARAIECGEQRRVRDAQFAARRRAGVSRFGAANIPSPKHRSSCHRRSAFIWDGTRRGDESSAHGINSQPAHRNNRDIECDDGAHRDKAGSPVPAREW